MSLLSDIFSDLFARQDNLLSRVDPRAKLIVALGILIAVIFTKSPLFPLFILVSCVWATLAIGVPKRYVALRLLAPLGVAVILLVLQSLTVGSTPIWIIQFFYWKIFIMKEGVRAGVLLASRVLGGMSVMLLLSAVTPAHRIFHALRVLGAPKGWVEIAMLMYRYVFVLLDLTVDVSAAQKVRLGYTRTRRGLNSSAILCGTVLLRSIDQAVRTNEAMRVRGYKGDIPLGPMPRMTWSERGVVFASLFMIFSLFFAMEVLLR